MLYVNFEHAFLQICSNFKIFLHKHTLFEFYSNFEYAFYLNFGAILNMLSWSLQRFQNIKRQHTLSEFCTIFIWYIRLPIDKCILFIFYSSPCRCFFFFCKYFNFLASTFHFKNFASQNNHIFLTYRLIFCLVFWIL